MKTIQNDPRLKNKKFKNYVTRLVAQWHLTRISKSDLDFVWDAFQKSEAANACIQK